MHTYVSSKVRAAFIYFHFEFFKLQRSRSKSLIDLNGRQYSVNSKFGNTFYLNFEPERSNQQDFYAFYDWTQAEKKFWNFTPDYFIKPCIVIVMVYKWYFQSKPYNLVFYTNYQYINNSI